MWWQEESEDKGTIRLRQSVRSGRSSGREHQTAGKSPQFRGKVVIGIAERAKKQNKKVIAVVGGADDSEIARAYEMGVTSVFPINRLPQDFSVSRHHSQENLAYTTDNILRLIAAK